MRRLLLACALCTGVAACTGNAGSLVASGDRYAAQKLYREAVIEYRKALEREPQNARAHLGFARSADRLGDTASAMREYVRAADLLPGDDEVQLKAGRFLLLYAQFDDAKRRAEAVLERNSNSVEAQVTLGLATAGLRDLDAALADVFEAIRLDPDRPRLGAGPPLLQQPRRQPDEGEKAIRRALELDPKATSALLAQANLCWSTGRQAEVERILVDALSVDPSNETARRALAIFYVSAGRVADAEVHFKAVAAASPEARAQFALADYFALAGRFGEAMAVLDPLTVRANTSSAAWTRVAAIQHAQKKTAEAYRTVDGVLGREQNNVGALLIKGRFLLADRRADEALAWLKMAVATDAGSATAQCLLGSAYEAMRRRDEAIAAYGEAVRINPRLTAAVLQLAQLQLDSGAPDAALESAERVIRLEPGSLRPRLLRVNAYLAKRDFDRAATELKGLADRYPDSADVQVELGTFLRMRQDSRGARAAFLRALALNPGSFNALSGLVALDLVDRNFQAASARVDARLAQYPGEASSLVLGARVAMAAGDNGRAEQHLLKAIEADAASVDAYGMLGRIYLAQNRLDRARERFEAIVKRQPSSVAGLTMIGLILQAENQPAEAQRHFQQALEINPRAPVAAVNLAALLADSGANLDIALQLAQTAKEQLPESPQVDDTLGWIYVKKELPSLAIPPLQFAAGRDPKNPLYQYHLGIAYVKAGDKAKARAALEQALTLDPNFAGSAEARKALTGL